MSQMSLLMLGIKEEYSTEVSTDRVGFKISCIVSRRLGYSTIETSLKKWDEKYHIWCSDVR